MERESTGAAATTAAHGAGRAAGPSPRANGVSRANGANGANSANSSGAKAPSRSEITRAAILDAARIVFVRDGYAETSIAVICESAGTSVGSLYHHFGGKADVFIALYRRFADATSAAAAAAVVHAREAGELDPVELFVAGARGYLECCRAAKDLTVLFLYGDGPPGFNALRRAVDALWVGQNSRLIRAEERRNGPALVQVLTTVCGSAGREVAKAATSEDAEILIADFCDLLRRLAQP